MNAAGLYADRVAREYGFSERYRILPFRGRYLLAEPGAPGVRKPTSIRSPTSRIRF